MMPDHRPHPGQLTENSGADCGVEARADELFRDHRRRIYERTDRWFAVLMLVQWVGGIVIALVVSPRTWAGSISQTHVHVWAAVLLGGAIGSVPIYLARLRPGAALTRHTIACAQMLWSALLIHLTGGRIETHFHVFGSLAFLAFYRDWQVFIPATLVVGVDHLIRGIYWPQSVYGVLTATPWRSLEHAAWVVFENIFLVRSCRQSVAEMWDIARQRARLESTNELVEVEVARRTEELRENELRTRMVIDTAADAVIAMDDKGTVREWNPQAERTFGWSHEEAMGRKLSEMIIPEELQAAHKAGLARYLATGESRILGKKIEVPAVRKDGARITVELTVGEMRTSKSLWFSAILHDLTERKRAEQELLDARQRADAANRAKSEFLANMSHEIRTPMNGIIGMTELALDGELTAQQQEYLNTVRECAYSLLNLLNGILDLSKIEAGKLELESTSFNLITTVESALDVLSHRANEKRLELICSIDPAAPRYVYGDPLRLMQVLLNLLGNALKFTEEGEVVVGTRLESRTGESVTLRFFVSDTGIGIPAERISAIFESFTQADGTTTRKYGGTGLGLTISRQIVELMGGTLWVESEPGKGSTFAFRVTLPCDEQTRFGPERLTAEGLTAEGQRTGADQPGGADALPSITDKRILVVDDNATNRRVLQLMLESWGCRVVVASGGNEALHVLRNGQSTGRPFDVLLLDVQMPDMDGLDVARTATLHSDFGRPHIVFLSSVGSRRDIDPENSTLCDACLTKPVKQSWLMDTLLGLFEDRSHEATEPRSDEGTKRRSDGATKPRSHEGEVDQSRERQRAEDQNRDRHGAVDKRHEGTKARRHEGGVNPSPIRVLVVEDNAVNRRVATGILQKFGCTVAEADNGRAALRMLEATEFDLVFMDLQMPTMDGLETTAVLRADDRWKDLPIIAMTAHAMKGDRDKCLAAGMNDYVAKPVRFDEVRNAIDKWARGKVWHGLPARENTGKMPVPHNRNAETQKQRNDGSTGKMPVPPDTGKMPMPQVTGKMPVPHDTGKVPVPHESAPAPVDVAMALINLAGDRELFQEVLAAFVEGLSKQLEELHEACARADVQRLGAIAHTLKGSASNVCAEPTRRLARRIEKLTTEGGIEAIIAQLPELKEEADRVRAFAATLVEQG